MKKRIQIPVDLYEMMEAYVNDHYDPDDSSRYWEIIQGIKQKQECQDRHLTYTLYKTSRDPEKKEKARVTYLDSIGMRDDFRWPGRCSSAGNNI